MQGFDVSARRLTKPQAVAAAAARAQDGFQRYGLAGTLYRVASLAGQSIVRSLYLRERHVWYELDLARPREPVPLAVSLELVCGDTTTLSLLDELPTIGRFEARARLQSGAQPWIVREGGRAVFACWIFFDRTPVLAARGGWLALAPGIVCLEDSVTSAQYRGRGVAPAAWSGIADVLAREGVAGMITKVAEANVPSRRAVEKVGFRPVAVMNTARVGPVWQVAVLPLEDHPVSTFLQQQLAR